MNANSVKISRQLKFIGLFMIFLMMIPMPAFAKNEEPLFFPEQKLFQKANDAFLKWRSGDASMWKTLGEEYGKFKSDPDNNKCIDTFGKDTEASRRCFLRAMTQHAVAFDIAASEEATGVAFKFYHFVFYFSGSWKLKPEPYIDFQGITSSDDFQNAINKALAAGWRYQRDLLEQQGIITGDPICVAYKRSFPHYMKAKQFDMAALASQSFLEYCQVPDPIVNRKQRHLLLGMLADAQLQANHPDKAITAAKERYYLLPDEESAKAYISMLTSNNGRSEIAKINEYGAKIRKRIERWISLNPRPDLNAERRESLEYNQRLASLYKNALEATDKLGLEGYDKYLLFEYNQAMNDVKTTKDIINAGKSGEERRRKEEAESDKFMGDIFDFAEGVQKLRR